MKRVIKHLNMLAFDIHKDINFVEEFKDEPRSKRHLSDDEQKNFLNGAYRMHGEILDCVRVLEDELARRLKE